MISLNSIAIEGFKSIAQANLSLGPLTVLIGPNGSGKSNFIGAFSFLRMTLLRLQLRGAPFRLRMLV